LKQKKTEVILKTSARKKSKKMKGKIMKISFEAPDEWGKLLDEEAKKDGHNNRAAVIRKIVNLFFGKKLLFSSVEKERVTTEE